MTDAAAARLTVWLIDRAGRMDSRGQGTVEYVGVVVTMALLLGAVAVAAKGWGNDIGNSLKEVVKDSVGFASSRLGGR
ncbi:MAG: hypothetical protein IT200_14265 [Thermoleophilia bacterium]|nr:hypothetical protein [Thermoleophilia bacterium]